ncbi:sensor histidine kinase [Litoribrevibacter albus]|uniref:histidine kinase n=1 Tax=Litoribrevibacter albus TaxID=1473156 RepID=A0AA37SC62_9GAMM|nr:HAMP domain-containing sensor histidine kinase [Litoribrevibacter albus]GLQ32029.1 two-component sensor histidine kinase [Litoribrevibacter albus]
MLYTFITTLLVTAVMSGVYYFSVGQVVRAQERNFSEAVLQHRLLSKQLTLEEYKIQFTPEFQLSDTLSFSFQWGANPSEIVGRLSLIPREVASCPQVSQFPVYQARYGAIEILTGCTIPAHDGRVLIAQNRQGLDRWQMLFKKASLFTLCATVLFGSICGWWFSRKLIRKVTLFNYTVSKVEQGDMTARVPERDNGDEFDEMAQHINRMLNQLESTFETIRGTTDAIAHDLRTPLNRMRLKLERLVCLPEGEIKADELADVLAELDTVLSTFNSMLELTRLEHGILSMDHEEINLRSVVEDALELIEPFVDDQGQSMTSQLNDVYLHGDRNLLFRAIYNLLDNAVKYSGSEAQIGVTLTDQQLVIADSGPGIAPDQIEKAFQRLGRLDSSRSQKGYGLGLSIVKAILKQQGMKIELKDNQPGLKVVIYLSRK